jgi:hypothetical protein
MGGCSGDRQRWSPPQSIYFSRVGAKAIREWVFHQELERQYLDSPETTTSAAEDWLDNEHIVEREARIARLEWLQKSFPQAGRGFLIPAGWLSSQLLEEAKYSFVHAQYIATCMLAFAAIERLLAASLYGAGDSSFERASGNKLLLGARDAAIISAAEFELFDRLRELRNGLIHFRRFGNDDTLESRWMQSSNEPFKVIEQDAKRFLTALFRLLTEYAV